MISINNLTVSIEGERILDNISLDFAPGINVILGPNGSGKSTLLAVIAGRPDCKIDNGTIQFDNIDITNMSVDQRSKLGIFLGFQNPCEIPGMPNAMFIAECVKYNSTPDKKVSKAEVIDKIDEFVDRFNMPTKLKTSRNVNAGFSGGEKKYNELLQMAMLRPKVAMLDEIDSGLDIDGTRTAINIINDAIAEYQKLGIIVTHYHEFAENLKPAAIHIINQGTVAASGGMEIIREVRKNGFRKFRSDRA